MQITETIVQTDNRADGITAVHALHDKGNAATLYGPVGGRFLAVDLDAPFVDIVDALADLLFGHVEDYSVTAEDEAMRLVKRGV